MKEKKENMDYAAYRSLMEHQVTAGETSGPEQSENRIALTKLNNHRMKRLDKSVQIDDSLANKIKELPDQSWYVLSETWCGDSAQLLPYINKMAKLNPNIRLEILLRDENPQIMDVYLTNGSRSIPKLFALSENNEELFSWGPRPTLAQRNYLKKVNRGVPKSQAQHDLHTFYTADKGKSLFNDFKKILKA